LNQLYTIKRYISPYSLAMQTQRGAGSLDPSHSQTRTRRKSMVRTTLRPLCPGKGQHPFHRRLGGPRRRSGRSEKLYMHRESISGHTKLGGGGEKAF